MIYRKIKNTLILFLILTNLTYSQNRTIYSKDSTVANPHKYIQKGYSLSNKNQDKAYAHFTNGANYYRNNGNKSAYLECLIGLVEIEKRKGKFNKSFEMLWDIMPEAKLIKDKSPLLQIHRKLGLLYGSYSKDSLSISHLKKSIELSKKTDKNALVSSYFSLAVQYVKMESYKNAERYLDSCYLNKNSKNRLIYIDAYYGLINTKKGFYNKAQIYFKNLIPEFKKRKLGFLAMLYSFNADLKHAINQKDSAIYYYKASLKIMNKMKVHIEEKPIVLENLSNIYIEKNDIKNAFKYTLLSKNISDSLYHTQSKLNKELFEIKNKYQEDIIEKEKQILAQNKLILLNEKVSFILKLLIVILVLLAIIVAVVYKQRNKMKQLKISKAKNESMLQIQNKELTANALLIIEKENAFKELLDIIKENAPSKYKSLSKKHKQSNKQIWEDFNLRFTQINSTFYNRLLKLHPTLTPNDLKHCALIKLKFDSKEMSYILGISLQSVHMARSRVRKKLNLNRKDNLSNYIAMI
ncbi:hypothetical protein GCM10022291_23820 [Postechiella marina]|uniref:Tetratricopeptide repeat protein n=1 Tax=Postechiella marina TaxID=943941 RepID=A0ABP8CC65_9FLAO